MFELSGYVGDVDIRHGGFFWSMDSATDDYATVTRVTPASDMEGPDNLFFVEHGTVWLGNATSLASALECIGYMEAGEPSPATKVDAIMAYMGMDERDSSIIQIGANDPFYSYGHGGFDMPKKEDITYLGHRTSLRGYLVNRYNL